MKSPLSFATDPPLTPDGDEARDLLREELTDPDYAGNLLERIPEWVGRVVDGMIGAATGASAAGAFVAIVLAFVLIAAVLLLASRFRRTASVEQADRHAVPDAHVTAAEWRVQAEAAFAADRYDEALVDAFRALAVGQIERGSISDLPQATAHELAGLLAAEFAAEAAAIHDGADLFDSVLYGDHTPSAEQARSVLELEERLGAVRR